MFAYPKQAEVNRPLPKNKIYEHAKPSRAVRNHFVKQVAEIVWKYKLSPETINLPARQGVEEIQIFEIALRTPELGEDVLRAIDKAIPSPIVFDLVFDGRIRTTAAYKRPSEGDSSRSVVDAYFETAWKPAAAARPPLPLALDLAGLYEQMLCDLMAVPRRPAEPLRPYVERVNLIRTKLAECVRLETRIKREVQFNRKVELNAQLRLRRAELADLRKP